MSSIFQVNAFTHGRFSGNPAAVVLLREQAEPVWMQKLAQQMNLSETAFVTVPAKGTEVFDLCWFTPETEVDLCGHATLASASVLWSEGVVPDGQTIRFQTRSGVLLARNFENEIVLTFPTDPIQSIDDFPGLEDALGCAPIFVGKGKDDLVVVVDSAETVRGLQPDFVRLAALPIRGVAVSAVSDTPEYDFISRFFAPAVGIDEDPATGSVHCALVDYWSKHLQKDSLVAFQASARGARLSLHELNNAIEIGGKAGLGFQR
ncbi:MAG: PhzF family phenazine biosynthesis protein [Gammaproteobacteria bacterium]|nr:PhzF family phenazine biosynthesis protein [Gammaproteobacteria bacterium]